MTTSTAANRNRARTSTFDLPCFCLRHSITTIALVATVLVLVQATPHFFPDSEVDGEIETVNTLEKRPARLSYFRAPSSRYRGRYRMPWDRLPNTNCLRKYCRSDGDCCRRYSKCNAQAHVCYDCWYGFPCSSSRDCCHRFPYCDPVRRTCAK